MPGRASHRRCAAGFTFLSGAWILAVVALSASTGMEPPARSAPAIQQQHARGKALYESACLSCHGPDGRGMPQTTLGFDIEVPDFTDCSFATPEPDADWAAVILHGGPVRAFDRRMPAFSGALSTEDVGAILGYVRTMCTDDTWPAGELNLPRPLRTEKAFPENEAVLTTTFDATGANSISNEFLYERRFGSRNQWEVSVPIDFAGSDARGWQRGLGDIAVGYKRVLMHSGPRGSILSAGGEIIFPTGKEDRGLGSGTTVVEPFVVFGQILPRDMFVQAHAALELSTNTDRTDHEGFWRVAAGKPGRRTAASAARGRRWSSSSGGATSSRAAR